MYDFHTLALIIKTESKVKVSWLDLIIFKSNSQKLSIVYKPESTKFSITNTFNGICYLWFVSICNLFLTFMLMKNIAIGYFNTPIILWPSKSRLTILTILRNSKHHKWRITIFTSLQISNSQSTNLSFRNYWLYLQSWVLIFSRSHSVILNLYQLTCLFLIGCKI